jgi:hypothetical protein
MALRKRPAGSSNPAEAYAPAFDISNFLPDVCRGTLYGLQEQNWPLWLVEHCRCYALTSEDLHGGLRCYIQAVKIMQTDPDCATVQDALERTGFYQQSVRIQVAVMARLMDYINAVFLSAIKDATVLVEGGTPVREDIAALVAAAERRVPRPNRWVRAWRALVRDA